MLCPSIILGALTRLQVVNIVLSLVKRNSVRLLLMASSVRLIHGSIS